MNNEEQQNSLENFTINEVAKSLKITPRTLYKYIQRGMIRGYKLGQNWRFTKTDINNFIEKQTAKETNRYVK